MYIFGLTCFHCRCQRTILILINVDAQEGGFESQPLRPNEVGPGAPKFSTFRGDQSREQKLTTRSTAPPTVWVESHYHFYVYFQTKTTSCKHFLPERQAPAYSLTVKTRSKALIDKTTDLNERNFLIRVLYKDCY